MFERVKLSKEVTLVAYPYYTNGFRGLSGYLRPPHKEFYDHEECCFRIEGSKLKIDKSVLQKYGIELEVG